MTDKTENGGVSINQIILGDCLEVMRGFKDNQFDLVLTDPPYGLDLTPHNRKSKLWTPSKTRSHEFYTWDKQIPPKVYFDEIRRVSKNQIIFGGNYFTAYLPTSRGWIVWDKLMTGDFSFGELAWTSFDRTLVKYEHLWNGFQQMAGLVEKRLHPTQKPVRLIKWIIRDYAKEGETILDPFMGSGTTLLAGKYIGRDCTGIEINPDYVKIAQDRLKQEVLL